MTGPVTVDIAGAQMGGAARYAAELHSYLGRTGRTDIRVIGMARHVDPAWLLRREISVPNAARRVAANNVSFVAPGGERWTLLRNALHFLTGSEACHLGPALRTSVSREAAVVRLCARRADVLVVPSTAMAERVTRVLPGVRNRITVRPHPVSAGSVPPWPREPAILCPVLFAPYKRMDRRLAELLAAIRCCGDPAIRVRVTASPADLPASLATDPRIELVGPVDPEDLRELRARSRAIYFPTGLESFGYPLAEARVSGQPVIARDTAQNREIAGLALCGFSPGDPDSLIRAVALALTTDVPSDPAAFDPDAYFDWMLSVLLRSGVPAMTKLGLRPYRTGDAPALGSVPVSVVVLTRDEEVNIRRCLASVGWADQVVVVDSGSADGTVPIARSLGAEVMEQPWLGFSAQREFALRLPSLRHDWVYFVDADEWICPQLAAEIAAQLRAPAGAGFAQRFRLVFQGTWIRHCGWYRGSWIVRLVDRRYTKFDGPLVGERACVDGPVRRLRHDIVDEDRKDLAAWLHKHVRYAQLEAARRNGLEAARRGRRASLAGRLRALRGRRGSRPMLRSVLKDVVFPSIPARPAALFGYMYIVRLGWLDGLAGLRFCFFHAWYEVCVNALHANLAAAEREIS